MSTAAGIRRDPLLGVRTDVVLGILTAALVAASGTLPLAAGRAEPAGLVAVAVCAAVAPALWRIDVAEHRLPNALTVPALAVAALAAVGPALRGDLAPLGVGLGIVAGLLLLSLVGGMGMGDVKLGAGLALATATYRADAAILGILLVFLVGGVAGLISLVRRRRTLAFGPFLIAGFALSFGLVVALG